MSELENKIKKRLRFFRLFAVKHRSDLFQKFWMPFLTLLEEYFYGESQEKKSVKELEDLVEQAKKVFPGAKEVK